MSGEHCICESEGFDERVRASTLDDDTAMDLSDLFKLFGDSTRLRILWVLKGNGRAIRFYEKCGFRFDGAEKTQTIGSPVTELRMVLNRQPDAGRS